MSQSVATLTVRVLVVEDNADDRELLLRQLRKTGMSDHVKFISDGKEALNFLTAPDPLPVAQELVAIFLDLNLPSLSGLDLLRALRECERFQATPLNVTNYVSKPVTFISFSKAVADVFHLPRNPAPAPSEG